ncbi:MAG TPA: EAL domain-containing protein [Acidimicrobiales bacterium]|nr:EAL domain-containing protein [Acidimicrobiales bacterium]
MTGEDQRKLADAGLSDLACLVLTVGLAGLTPRQRCVVTAVGIGDTMGEAAQLAGISPSAMPSRLRGIANRLGLSDTSELIRLARQGEALNSSPDAMFAMDGVGLCVFANRRAAELFGYTQDEMLGADIHRLVHGTGPDGSPVAPGSCLIQSAVTGREAWRGEELLWHRDGSPVWVSYEVVPLSASEGRIASVVKLEDVTARMRSASDLAASHASLQLALEATQTIAFRTDLGSGRTMTSNNAWAALERTPGDRTVTYADFQSRIHPDDRHKADLDRIRATPPGRMVEEDLRTITAEGEVRLYRCRIQVIADMLGQPSVMLGVATDVTDRHEAERAYTTVVGLSSDAYIGMDSEGRVTEWNPAAETIFGYRSDEAVGAMASDLIVPRRHRQQHLAGLQRVVADEPVAARVHEPIEVTARRADGTEVPIELRMATVPVGQKVVFRAFARDISARKEMEAALRRQGVTDQLTGVANRAVVEDHLALALKRLSRGSSAISVLFIDVDRLKVINDSLGHGTGDEILRQLAARLADSVRPHDTVGRFGADSFVVICEDMEEREAVATAQRLLAVASEAYTVDARELSASVSVGIAVTADPEADAESLLRDADAALFRAKERGRGCAELFDEPTRRRAVARLEMEEALRGAVDAGDLALHYQPVVDPATGAIIGAEALLRWDRPTLGRIPPAEFIPVAEETGLILVVGRWVLRQALRDLAAWRRQGACDLELSVNVSGRQLLDGGLVDEVAALLAESGVPSSALCLEITETALMEDTDRAAVTIGALHRLGVTFAVDDFGTGYSSLLYLRRFPISVVKLDRSFVAGLGHNGADRAIVRATIDLAHSLDMRACAEGVEEAGQLQELRDFGCDLAQGHLWSEAIPASELAAMLAARPTVSA